MKKKILIVEDEKEVALLYSKFLRSNGYDTVVAFDGVEALEKLNHMQPDLILLDLMMPRMNGMEFYQNICGPEEKPKYPVLVLTARMDLEALFRDVHVDGFIIKPFERANLLKEIEFILNKQYFKAQDGHIRDVFIIDDHDCSSKIAQVFSKAGYNSKVMSSGVSGIEAVMANPPDLVLVNLSLADISGDLVILRLQQMAKTRYVSYVLYVERHNEHSQAVLDKISQKRGVQLLCEYVDPSELLQAAVKVFQKSEQLHPAGK